MAKNNIIYVNPDEAPWVQYNQDLIAILAHVEQSSHVMWLDAYEGLRFPKDSEIDKVHEIVKLLGTHRLADTALLLFQVQAAFIDVSNQWNGLSEIDVDGFVLR
jgi:hypothetical protein